jgi:hypothetical protein
MMPVSISPSPAQVPCARVTATVARMLARIFDLGRGLPAATDVSASQVAE